jgi:hypothetical protein
VIAVAPWAAGLAVVAAAVVGLGTIMQLFSDNWSIWWAQIQRSILASTVQLIANIGTIASWLGRLAEAAGATNIAAGFNLIVAASGNAVTGIKGKFDELAPEASKTATSMSTAFGEFMTQAKDAATTAGGWISTKIAEGAAGAANAVTASADAIKGQLGSLGSAAQLSATAIAAGVSEKASPALKTALGTLETLQQKWDKIHEEPPSGGGGGIFQPGGGALPSSLPEAIASGQLAIGGQNTMSPTSMDISGLGEGVPSSPINFTPTIKTDTGSAPLSSDYFMSMDDAIRGAMGTDHPLPFTTYASGSPKMPFTDYFSSYAPGVMSNFVAGIPGMDFTSNFSDLSAGVRTHLSAGIALGAQGLAADPAQLSNMIASLQNYVAMWQGVNKTLTKFGEQDPFGLMAGIRPQDTSAGQAASAGRLLAMLQTLQQQIMGMNSAKAANDRTAAAAERTAAGVESLGSAMFSGRFIQGISTGVTRNQRSLYGNPTTRIGV